MVLVKKTKLAQVSHRIAGELPLIHLSHHHLSASMKPTRQGSLDEAAVQSCL